MDKNTPSQAQANILHLNATVLKESELQSFNEIVHYEPLQIKI